MTSAAWREYDLPPRRHVLANLALASSRLAANLWLRSAGATIAPVMGPHPGLIGRHASDCMKAPATCAPASGRATTPHHRPR
jgi:hypothetical protein